MPLSPSAQKMQDFLTANGYHHTVVEHNQSTRTSAEAAEAIGCTVAQIAKSIVFRAGSRAALVITSGANRVDPAKAGKALGVSCFSLLAVKLGLARLPESIDAGHVLGVGLLAGIGFTMSIFVTELSFNDAQAVTLAKTGIILASLLAGALGYGWLRLMSAITKS